MIGDVLVIFHLKGKFFHFTVKTDICYTHVLSKARPRPGLDGFIVLSFTLIIIETHRRTHTRKSESHLPICRPLTECPLRLGLGWEPGAGSTVRFLPCGQQELSSLSPDVLLSRICFGSKMDLDSDPIILWSTGILTSRSNVQPGQVDQISRCTANTLQAGSCLTHHEEYIKDASML